MSTMDVNAIVIGCRWYSDNGRTEVTLVGSGDRAHLDRLVAQVPERWRTEVAQYLAPLLEQRRPPHGRYQNTHGWSAGYIAWWKPCEVLAQGVGK